MSKNILIGQLFGHATLYFHGNQIYIGRFPQILRFQFTVDFYANLISLFIKSFFPAVLFLYCKVPKATTFVAFRFRSLSPRGGGTRYIKKVGMLVENFEIDP